MYRALYCWSLLFALAVSFAAAPAADEAALRALVERYFAAYPKADLAGLMALWSEKSPDLAGRRRGLQQLFAEHNQIVVKEVALQEVVVNGEQATAHVVLELSAVETKSGQPAKGLGKSRRALEFVREAEAWKVWRDLSAAEELADSLVSLKTPEEAMARLSAEPEAASVELRQALTARASRQSRQGNYQQALSICQRLTACAVSLRKG